MEIIVTCHKAIDDLAEPAPQSEWIGGNETYFRYLGIDQPTLTKDGDRIYFVDDSFIRGFYIINSFDRKYSKVNPDTGKKLRNGWYAYFLKDTLKWINPIFYNDFSGWRYLNDIYKDEILIMGNHLDVKPTTPVKPLKSLEYPLNLKTIIRRKRFYYKGDFESLHQANSFIYNMGYCGGSLDSPNQYVALRKGYEYDLPQKWHNFKQADKINVDGVIHSTDFRNGPVDVYFFNIQ